MTGPEHYREAERLLAIAGDDYEAQSQIHAEAQIHATLALAAATAEPIAQAYNGREDVSVPRAWSAAIS